MILSATRVVTPARVLAPGWLRVTGDRITEVGEGHPPAPADAHAELLVPGFVDIHGHGGGGFSHTDGDPEASRAAVRAHLAHGTTTQVASLVTDSLDTLVASLRALRPLVADGALAGLHLEGPWLSFDHPGAHDTSHLCDPTPAAVDAVLDAADGALSMVTLAPERAGGLDAVRRLAEAGVTVAVGHTDATYDQTRAALDAGATVGTHLFNCMRRLHHREPGVIGALLGSDAYVELVADGVHLHDETLRLAFAAAPGRPVLITDAMGAAAAADGDYLLGPMAVEVRDGLARIATTGAIAGSTLTSLAAVRHAVRFAGIPLVDAVRAATATPAAALGLPDVGELRAGARADLVLLDDDLGLLRVLHAGEWLSR
ncbi:N-acetylglucosamine-6-phosphate deacetylase [Nocardioides gansuensis]|uniref:N-acetylglucosamine-6-phosphate deacetylase n=1 Tax=Nocardioides gansuensis TaxID=2138300 RepID=A0A2T8FF01_9ACTN|nr:N-acetylglucosamine-6-phosphate deacetylase [Nocardioides gansuensis]PVG84286.1 N-acetylglucosamine-6-phosphate deacetylase [Nocardioides gansuensis]